MVFLRFIAVCTIAAISSVEAGTVGALSAKTFKATLKNHEASLVEFYAPWCGHCKALEPKYAAVVDSLQNQHKDLNIGIYKADAVEQQALASKFGIQSYPTIKLFYGSNEVEKYEGQRETDALVQYVVSKVADAPKANNAASDAKGKTSKKKRKNRKNGAANKKKDKKKNKRNTKQSPQSEPDNQAVAVDALTKEQKAAKWREELGRSTWHLLHSMAAKFPKEPTQEQKDAAVNMVQSLQALYPCELCRAHLNEKMGTSKPLVSSRKAFSSWVCMLHNLVNDDLGKDQFDCTLKHLDEVYAKDCSGCVVNGTVEDLSGQSVAFGSNIEVSADGTQQVDGQPVTATQYKQRGSCTIDDANKHYWLDVEADRSSADLTDGKLTIVFFYAVTCHVCHEIHPVLKVLHEDFADRGLNIIGVHQSIYGDIEKKFETQAIDYHALEELPYPALSHQHTATKGDGDRVALPNSLFAMAMGRDGFGVPAMAVMKDCNTVWRGMGFQLKQIDDWIRSHADQYLAPA